LKVRNPMHEW